MMIACCGLAEQFPFADGAFDRVVMVDAFQHLHDQHVAAKETLRVLRPGGRLVIEEPDIRRWAVKWTALGERLLLMRSRFYSIADLVGIFKEAGARIVAIEEGHDYNVRLAVERPPGRPLKVFSVSAPGSVTSEVELQKSPRGRGSEHFSRNLWKGSWRR